MSDRKVYATVEGSVTVLCRVKREVSIRIDEGGDTNAALEAAAKGETSGDDWDLVDCGDLELQDEIEQIDKNLDYVDDDLISVDNVNITDSK